MAVSRLRDEAQRLVGHAQSLQVQLRAERAAVSRLEEEVQVYKTEAASVQQNISELNEQNSCDGDMENKAGKTHIIELALSECAHVESRTEVGQLQDIHDWVGWMGDHLPCYMLHQHCPRIVAALLLHTFGCMVFGESFLLPGACHRIQTTWPREWSTIP